MKTETIKIIPLLDKITLSRNDDGFYTLCWIQNGVQYMEINGKRYDQIANAVFFLTPDVQWNLYKTDADASSGYLIYLPKNILNHPTLRNFNISRISLFKSADEILKINLAPGIEKRVQSVIEMLDELVSTNLRHKEEAILSLLNTFFVYCDGECNIKSVISDDNAKGVLVYKFKKNIDLQYSRFHDVRSYARQLHVSEKYLNECVKDILGRNAKSLIDEQLIMRARHELKFTDKSVKEVGFGLGFTSADYFTYFVKKHTGLSPSQLRKD